MPAKIDVVGQRFGACVVESDAAPNANGRRRVSCRCDCGSIFTTEPRALRGGHTTSCGCRQRAAVASACRRRSTHAMTRSREYNSWLKLRSRCQNPSDPKYADYGGRGIQVCGAWDASFEAFLADMGAKPTPSATIDRIDVDGHYTPENCRWASPKEQARNKRNHRLVNHGGRSMPLSEACELAGVNYRSALYRLNRGKPWAPLPAPPQADGGEG